MLKIASQKRLDEGMKIFKALVFFLSSMVFSGSTAIAEEVRLALLIGNAEYPANIGALSNTHSDVRILGDALNEVGFVIETGFDLDKSEMTNALDKFEKTIATEKSDGNEVIAFFYFSGHGTALYRDRQAKNFLLPARISVNQLGQVYRKAIELEEVLGSLSLSGADMVFVVSDACRDELNLSSSKSIGEKGLARVSSRPGLLLTFATAAGETAPDDGLLAKALAAEIVRPGQEAIVAFYQALADVSEWRGSNNQPFMAPGKLRRGWCFAHCEPETNSLRAPGREVPDARYAPSSKKAALLAGGDTIPEFGVFTDCETCPAMVRLPAAKVMTGSPVEEVDRDVDEDQTEVHVEGFAISRREVSVGDLKYFMSETGYRLGTTCQVIEPSDQTRVSDIGFSWVEPGYRVQDDSPASCVNYFDALAYTEWLSSKTGHTYRLPTEHEWEYAARGGRQTAFAFGPTLRDGDARFRRSGSVASLKLDDMLPLEMMGHPANSFGLYDMHGNVWEWTSTCYSRSTDPAKTPKFCSKNVIRGGAWSQTKSRLRSANRGQRNIADRLNDQGFRLVREFD